MQWLQILTGDCRDILPTLEPESVQCCVTSPPYWGLRDYGTASWEGGSAECEHIERLSRQDGERKTPGGRGGSFRSSAIQYSEECKCGARRIDSQLGLESTPEEYITKIIAVFREVWRVLRDDGMLWVNMGDCYAHNGACGGGSPIDERNAEKYGRIARPSDRLHGRPTDRDAQIKTGGTCKSGLKPKDLVGIPWRLAFALQSDGWYLRSDIIWHKPNPMPESCTDRPTKAHEYIFLLAKQEKYFYDADAIREPTQFDSRNEQWGSSIATTFHDHSDDLGKGLMQKRPNGFVRMSNPLGRNKRTVWTVATQPYPEAHFATFPEDLIKPCILAGSRLGDTILDPFAGSGTTGKVALELGRKTILIELNSAYIKLAEERTFVTPGFL